MAAVRALSVQFGLGAAVFVVALAVFAPSVRYRFVELDDRGYFAENEHVLGGLTRENVAWAFTNRTWTANWHPLTWVSLMADATLLPEHPDWRYRAPEAGDFRRLPLVVHLHNVVLHACSALLFFVLLSGLFRREGASACVEASGDWVPYALAAFAALAWALHPLRVEPVCWGTERKELLSVFFLLAALCVYALGRGAQRLGACAAYGGALVCYLGAVLSKPVAVSLPAVLFAYDWVVCRRRFGGAVLRAVPFGGLAVACCLFTLRAQSEAIAGLDDVPWWHCLVSGLENPLVYLWQGVWPVSLSCYYPTYQAPRIGMAVLGALFLVGLAGVCVTWLRRPERPCLRALVWGVVWGYVGVFPMVGFVRVGNQVHADRFTYWPSLGVVAALALAGFYLHRDGVAARWVGRARRVARAVGAESVLSVRGAAWGAAGVLALLAWGTRAQMPVWRDTLALYGDAVAKSWNPSVSALFAQYAAREGGEGVRVGEAALRETCARNPCADADVNLAYYILAHRLAPGTAEARGLARRVLAGKDGASFAPVYVVLSNADAQDEEWRSALANARKALKLATAEQRKFMREIEGQMGFLEKKAAEEERAEKAGTRRKKDEWRF